MFYSTTSDIKIYYYTSVDIIYLHHIIMANSGNLSPAESWDYNYNIYVVLGVAQNDDIGTIKRAYYTLMREHHPDNGGSAEESSRLSHAFEIMSDPSERAKYDNMLNDIQNNAEFYNLRSAIISTTRRANQVNKPRVSKKDKSTKKEKQKRRRVNHQPASINDEHPKPIRGGGGNGSLSSDANEKMPADDNVSNKSSKSRGGKKKKQKVKNNNTEVIDLMSPDKKMKQVDKGPHGQDLEDIFADGEV